MTTESNTYECASLLSALLSVSLEDVNENFRYIVEIAEKNLDDLVDYVERLYVCVRCGRGKRSEAPRFPPEIWTVSTSLLNSDYGMNSAEEGWYSKFHKLIVHHPSSFNSSIYLKTEG